MGGYQLGYMSKNRQKYNSRSKGLVKASGHRLSVLILSARLSGHRC